MSTSTSTTPWLLDPTAVSVDPHCTGYYMRLACAGETVINIISFIVLFFYPQQVLQLCVSSPSEVTASSIFLVQVIGALILALTPQLMAVYPNNRRISIDSRPMAYLAYMSAELLMIPLILYQSLQSPTKAGISPGLLQLVALGFTPFVAWRFYSLFINPSVMGRYKTPSKQL